MKPLPGNRTIWTVAAFVFAVAVWIFVFLLFRSLPAAANHIDYAEQSAAILAVTVPAAIPAKPVVTHIPTPTAVKALYITACTASEARLRDKVLATMAGTEINSMMIDLKDYTGTLSFASTTVPVPPGGKGCKIIDLPQFVQELHDKGIYAIGRITVFQDPLYAAAHPEVAVASRSHPDRPWTDKNGLAYIDPDHESYWDHVVAIAKEAHSIGFDEINFDYIRFASDGDMSDARFAVPASTTKAAVIKGFFSYLHSALAPDGITMSADLFGQTTVNTDDLGIGQVLENALPYFDYVAPMVYPSHFIDGFEGYDSPAAHPYGVIKFTMTRAVERAVAASSTPDKLRPWLQAFDYKAVYTPAMVQSEKQAAYDSGLDSYMLWNAGSVYNAPELMPAPPVKPAQTAESSSTRMTAAAADAAEPLKATIR